MNPTRSLSPTVTGRFYHKHLSESSKFFCQYALCPKKGKLFKRREMIKFDNLFFCSPLCLQSFQALNQKSKSMDIYEK